MTGLAVDPKLGYIWNADQNVVNGFLPLFDCGESGAARQALMAWDAEGHELECDAPSGAGQLAEVRGMAISPGGLMFVSTGQTGHQIKVFKLPQPAEPEVVDRAVSGITMKTARLRAQIKPGFLPTDVRFEYGTQSCASSSCTEVESETVYGLKPADIRGHHRRAPAEHPLLLPGDRRELRRGGRLHEGPSSPSGSSISTATTAKTSSSASRPSRALLDCRAYELASAHSPAAMTSSPISFRRGPLRRLPAGRRQAALQVVNGGIPGTGSPTNRGMDPYVATRGGRRWTTKYVGIPADDRLSTEAFVLDPRSVPTPRAPTRFAFGGPEICDPCFADGSTGIPVRLPDG